ncbi:purine permease [Clathrospora elynae]|uniref:Purine permease n=1 Tax=Clathrospora elynae TaxID=706981 RepID=A0A6A5SHW9_9PLEO|nr:purine permease [Clathrospora elynae]
MSVEPNTEDTLAEIKYALTTKDGWVGGYDYVYLITRNIWPLNRKYKDYRAPFYSLNDRVPVLLTLLLRLQHALTMIGSIVSPPLAIASGAFNFEPAMTKYLASTAFITTGIATTLQIKKLHIMKTPFFIGTGLLSVVGPTFDILTISRICPVVADGKQGPCPDAWGACLGTMLCCVWIQIAMAFVPPKILNEVFPKLITGSLLTLIGQSGAPLMRSASVIKGLAVGCIISGATGYWSSEQLNQAPGVTFLWVHTFKLSVDGALVLPMIIMFACQAVSCIPNILAAAELSNVYIEGTELNSRIQGSILCDGIGNFFSAFAMGPPMVSQAGTNGVIVLIGYASRRAGWAASGFLILMDIIAKFGAVFAFMPPSVLGGMQVFLYSTIVVAGIRVLALISWTRRDRFILAPDWFAQILAYDGPNVNLIGFEQGINLAVQTPFVIAAIVGIFLNAVLPKDNSSAPVSGYGDGRKHQRIGERED